MKIAIAGYDVEGKASFDYFAAQGGYEITILDQNAGLNVPEGVDSVLGPNYLDRLDRFDLIIRTAGLQPAKMLEKNPDVKAKITTHINEFFKASLTKNIIGVTGTKGKGTTSTLIAKMLEAVGKEVKLGGNIGLPPLSFLSELNSDTWVVLELSSFQLIDLKQSPHIGICLSVMPEHLDWHSDTDEYIIAKTQLFTHQNSDDIAIFNGNNENSTRIASVSPGWKIPFMKSPGAFIDGDNIVVDQQVICPVSEIKLPGKHNLQNVCSALTATWKITQDAEKLRSVLTSFASLPHRLELVRELNGVGFYNDSYGTTPETAIAAVQAFSQPEILILGGRTKGVPFDELAAVIAGQSNVKQVITIGEIGPEISQLLKAKGFNSVVEGGKTIEEIVSQASELAESGDVVLFSPGATSFDMFKNYEERGQKFTAAVQSLA